MITFLTITTVAMLVVFGVDASRKRREYLRTREMQ
jgi:hypothetical protein